MARKPGMEPLRNITNTTNAANATRSKQVALSSIILSETEENARQAHMRAEEHEICSMHKYNELISRYYESLDQVFNYKEGGITFEMRSLLVDWVINCHEQLRLSDDSLHLSIFIIDRFLSGRTVPPQKLQLVGLTSLVIAAKYEEVVCPDSSSFLLLVGNAFDGPELNKAEKYILYSLNYKIEFLNPLYFLRRSAKANHYEAKSRRMAKYFIELMMLHREFSPFTKSVLGATAMYLARKICQTDYNKNLFFHYAKITKEDLRPCFDALVRVIYHQPKFDNVEAKYSKPSAHEVSILARRYAQQHFR